MRCGIYVRVSTNDQRDNGYSIDSQLRMIKDYCEPIIDEKTWSETRKVLEKNKHSNYWQYVHLFTGLVKCPDCKKILSSTMSFKNKGKQNEKIYYFLTCKNPNCKSKGINYSCERIEKKC